MTIHNIITYTALLSLMVVTTMLIEHAFAEADLYVAVGIICMASYGALRSITHDGIRMTVTDAIVCMWLVYYVGRTWYGNEYPCRTEFLKAIEMVLFYASVRLMINKARVPEGFLVWSIIIAGAYEALYGAWQMMAGSSRHPLYAMTGNFQNPGPYSAYLMLGLTIGVAAWTSYKSVSLSVKSSLLHYRVFQKIFQHVTLGHVMLAVMTPMCIMLPATWSRAAFASVALTALWLFRKRYEKYRFVVWGVVLLMALGFYFMKQGSADGRLIIWHSLLTTWQSCPWFGVGTGGFSHAFAEGMVVLHNANADLSSAGVTDNAFNILLKILVEHGVVGAILAVMLTVSVLMRLHKASKPLFYGMVSLLVFAMFSYPFDLLPYKILAVMIVAWSESVAGKTINKLGRIETFAVSCVVIFCSWHTYRYVKESYEADRDYMMIKGLHDKAFIKDYYALLSSESDNAEFLFDFGKILREQGRYNDSNACLSKGTLCSADPMFYVLMGNNYRDMAQFSLAEKSYYRAFRQMPNRLYPLYQLMLMYMNNGDTIKARNTAKCLLDMKPKIESPATRDMQKKADEIIRGSVHITPLNK